jgi:hypothetical protein
MATGQGDLSDPCAPLTLIVGRRKNKMQKRISFLITIMVVIVLLGIAYYQFYIPSQFNFHSFSAAYPEFLGSVTPEPNSKVSFVGLLITTVRSRVNQFPYAGGISATLYPIELDSKENLIKDGDQLFSLYSERTNLLVDGVEVSKDAFFPLSGLVGIQFLEDGNITSDQMIDGGPYWLHWYPLLWPGRHHAEILIRNRAGETKKYDWEFLVTIW